VEVLLGCVPITGKHTGVTIADKVLEVIRFYKTESKVVKIITDSASIKSYLNQSNSETGNFINKFLSICEEQVARDTTGSSEIADITTQSEADGDDESGSGDEVDLITRVSINIQRFESGDDMESEEIEEILGMVCRMNYSAEGIPCVLHSLNNAVKDSLKIEDFAQIIKKCSRIVRKGRKTIAIQELIRELGKCLKTNNVTRWCSVNLF
jgi:hypothetical protein